MILPITDYNESINFGNDKKNPKNANCSSGWILNTPANHLIVTQDEMDGATSHPVTESKDKYQWLQHSPSDKIDLTRSSKNITSSSTAFTRDGLSTTIEHIISERPNLQKQINSVHLTDQQRHHLLSYLLTDQQVPSKQKSQIVHYKKRFKDMVHNNDNLHLVNPDFGNTRITLMNLNFILFII